MHGVNFPFFNFFLQGTINAQLACEEHINPPQKLNGKSVSNKNSVQLRVGVCFRFVT